MIQWPPRSPNLTPLDFFLWEYVKNKVYQFQYTDLAELKRAIHQEIEAISKNTFIKCFFRIFSKGWIYVHQLMGITLNICYKRIDMK